MIGVVTVTYNSADVLGDFLSSLFAQSVDFQLFAVDNASADGSLEILRAVDDDRVHLLAQLDNRGIAVGNNVGINAALAAGCEHVLLLNNDTVFGPTLLEDLLGRATSDSAAVVIPSIRYFDEPDRVWFEAARFARWRGSVPVALDPAPAHSVTSIECACTCCALFDSAVFGTVGMMDEQYFVYWDDTDFFFRCDEAGVAMVLDANIKILHKVSTLTGGEDSDFSQTERTKNRVYFVRKHHRGLRRITGLAFTLVNVAQLSARGSDRRRRASRLMSAFRAGLALGADRGTR